LKINGGNTFTIKYDNKFVNHSTWYTKLILKSSSYLRLKSSNAKLIIERTNWFNPKKLSHIDIENGSEIVLNGFSYYCNEGSIISGPGIISFAGTVQPCGVPAEEPCYFSDSVKIIVEDTASFEIPDSTTYIFEGNQTVLNCKNLSTIKFGKGSKLIFNDGAKIIANNTKFTTIDSNTTWDGIYLNDLSYDTLKKNAYLKML
jgi:hypothetical protein